MHHLVRHWQDTLASNVIEPPVSIGRGLIFDLDTLDEADWRRWAEVQAEQDYQSLLDEENAHREVLELGEEVIYDEPY
jgi:hypothetical protein